MFISDRSEFVRRLITSSCAGIALAAAFSVSQAWATPYTFSPFNITASNDFNSVAISGAPVGTVFTSYSITANWSAVSGDPYSEEAGFGLVNSLANISTIYQDITPSDNGASNGNPITLQWNGFLSEAYTGGDPLEFVSYQSFTGSIAQWNNVTVTLDSATATPPPSTSLGIPGLGQSNSVNGALNAGSVSWIDFTYTGGTLTFDTLGTVLPDAGFGVNDTEIGLYNALGGFLTSNDDIGPGQRESALTLDETDLTIGEKYYLAVGAYDVSFGGGFGATSDSTVSGTYRLNVTNGTPVVVPEGSSASLVGIAGLFCGGIAMVRRRRLS